MDIREDEVFFKLKKTTTDTKLRWTQYRVLHNILTTNKMVAKYNLDQNENCTFCDRYPESIEHLFWNCGLVKNFWNNLNLLLNTKYKHIHNFKFNKVLILMGCDSQTKTDTVADLIRFTSQAIYVRSRKPRQQTTFFKTFYIEDTKTKRNWDQQRFDSEVHRAVGTIHKYFQIPHKAIHLNKTHRRLKVIKINNSVRIESKTYKYNVRP